jgi:hypothetical protein
MYIINAFGIGFVDLLSQNNNYIYRYVTPTHPIKYSSKLSGREFSVGSF